MALARYIPDFHEAMAGDEVRQALVRQAVATADPNDPNAVGRALGYQMGGESFTEVAGQIGSMLAKVAPIAVSMVGGPEASVAVAAGEAALAAVKGDFAGAGLSLLGALPGVGTVSSALGDIAGSLGSIPLAQLAGAVVQVGKGNVLGGLVGGAVAAGGANVSWLDDVSSAVSGFLGGAQAAPPSETPMPEAAGGAPIELGPPSTSILTRLPVVGGIIQSAADKVAGWIGMPTSVDVSKAQESFLQGVADNAATALLHTLPGFSPNLPGSPSVLPGGGDKLSMNAPIGASVPRSTVLFTGGGGGDSGGGGAGRGVEIDLPGGIPAMLPEPGYSVPGSGGSMACPMPNVPSLASQRNAILCALSQKLNVRISPKQFLGLSRLGPAFLVFAQALGLDASQLLVLLLSSRHRRRSRGISSRDIRTTKRVGRQFRSLQHALSGVAPHHRGHSNVIPFRRRRRRAA